MFRNRFIVCALLTLPVLYLAEPVQQLLGYRPPAVPGLEWVSPALTTVIYLYGGLVFVRGGLSEVAARLPAGSGLVYRAFGAEDALAVAERLRAITHERGVVLLIGSDADLADRVGADGVHLPERALSAAYALGGKRPDWLLTGAVHSVEAVERARDLDAVVLSPIFPPGGPSARRPALGLPALKQASRQASLPVYALGGIDADRAETLIDSGACGIAGVEAIARAFTDQTVRI